MVEIDVEKESDSKAARNVARPFSPTRWSVVLAAGSDDSREAQQALTTLCEQYWVPVYAFIRCKGNGPVQSQDLTQSFFENFLAREAFSKANPNRGRFRSFLLTAVRHFLVDEHARATAAKRGGGTEQLSIDCDALEERLQLELDSNLSPDKVFDRRWATELLEGVMERLEVSFARSGNPDLFRVFVGQFWGSESTIPVRELARRFNMSESLVKVTMHRLRQRFRTQLRAAIAETVEHPDQIDAELRDLADILRG